MPYTRDELELLSKLAPREWQEQEEDDDAEEDEDDGVDVHADYLPTPPRAQPPTEVTVVPHRFPPDNIVTRRFGTAR